MEFLVQETLLMNNTIRFLKSNEFELMKSMFDHNPYANGFKLSEDEIIKFCNTTLEGIDKGFRQVAINMDNSGDPIAMSVGIEKPGIAGWIQGLTTIRYTQPYLANNPLRKFFTSKIVAETLDFLVTYMESKKYYKFWDISIDTIANTGRQLVVMQTETLHRYDYYDELVIPPGKLSGVPMFDAYRRIHPTENLKVRMFVLRQEYRVKLI